MAQLEKIEKEVLFECRHCGRKYLFNHPSRWFEPFSRNYLEFSIEKNPIKIRKTKTAAGLFILEVYSGVLTCSRCQKKYGE